MRNRRSVILFISALLGVFEILGLDIRQSVDLDETNITIAPKADNNGECNIDWGEMTHETKEGKPELPVYYATMAIPMEATDIKAGISNVVLGQRSVPMDAVPLVIAQRTSTAGSSEPVARNGESLYSDSEICAEITNDYIIKGRERYITVKVVPFSMIEQEYWPVTQFDITVSYDTASSGFGSYPISTYLSDITKKTASRKISNLYKGEYFIITTEKLKEACTPLSVWKTQKGLRVTITTIEEILAMDFSEFPTPPVDEAEAVRYYLQANYYPDVDQYCMLIGPSTQIPYRSFYRHDLIENENGLTAKQKEENMKRKDIHGDNHIPTDLYYRDLISDFKLEKKFGIQTTYIYNIPYSPSIYVGRLLCDTPEEINRYFRKLMIYEAFPGLGDSEYLSSGMVLKQTHFADKKDNIVVNLGTMEDITILVGSNEPKFENAIPTGRDVIQAMDKAGLISLIGHGNPGTIGCAGIGEDHPNWRFIKALEYSEQYFGFPQTEEGGGMDMMTNYLKPSVIYSVSCSIMPFDKMTNFPKITYNMGSSYTVGGMYGGVAMLGNTRTGYLPYGSYLENEFTKLVKTYRNMGKAYSNALLCKSIDMYDRATHNFIGDPEFSLWLKSPDGDSTIPLYSQYNVNLYSSNLPDYSITLYSGEGQPVSITTDQTSFQFTPGLYTQRPGCYVLSLWKDGTLPYIHFVGKNDVISNDTKRFYVRTAQLGDFYATDNFTVKDNGLLEVSALSQITIGTNVSIEAGGKIHLASLGEIEGRGVTVKSGGNLEMRGSEVVLSEGFEVQEGAEASIEAVTFPQW